MLNRRHFLLMITGSVTGILEDKQAKSDNARTDEITPNDSFFVQTYSARVPEPNRDTWRLMMGGLVIPFETDNGPVMPSFSWQDIQNLPAVEEMRTLACIGNPTGGQLIGNARWKGVRLIELLQLIQVQPEATHAVFTAEDGYQTALEMGIVNQPGVLLAYKMNGEPLSREHGYPLRLLVPGLYGMKMPKWITRIDFVNYEFRGYWESRGWSNKGETQTHAIIQHPAGEDNSLHPHINFQHHQPVRISGIAFAGWRDIVKIEIRIDGGAWIPAQLIKTEPANPLAWIHWQLNWSPQAPGLYTIEARATDHTGFTQFETSKGRFNDSRPQGSAAIHQVVVEVVKLD